MNPVRLAHTAIETIHTSYASFGQRLFSASAATIEADNNVGMLPEVGSAEESVANGNFREACSLLERVYEICETFGSGGPMSRAAARR